jgi:hypothetical protein
MTARAEARADQAKEETELEIGRALGYHGAAAMLRRGTVQP